MRLVLGVEQADVVSLLQYNTESRPALPGPIESEAGGRIVPAVNKIGKFSEGLTLGGDLSIGDRFAPRVYWIGASRTKVAVTPSGKCHGWA